MKIYAVNRSLVCPAQTFLDETLEDTDYDSVFAIFAIIDNRKGRVTNGEKFRKLGISHRDKQFWEVKKFKIRIGCFWEADYKLYLTHGFFKKADEWPQNQIQLLKNIYDDYLKVGQ